MPGFSRTAARRSCRGRKTASAARAHAAPECPAADAGNSRCRVGDGRAGDIDDAGARQAQEQQQAQHALLVMRHARNARQHIGVEARGSAAMTTVRGAAGFSKVAEKFALKCSCSARQRAVSPAVKPPPAQLAPGVPLSRASIRAANADAREGKDFASIGINDARTAPVPTVGIMLNPVDCFTKSPCRAECPRKPRGRKAGDCSARFRLEPGYAKMPL